MGQDRLSVRVIAKWQEATGAFSFVLGDVEGRVLPPFTAGAHIEVDVAPGITRQYSLCTPVGHAGCYEICVLLEPNSRGGSKRLIEAVKIGDILSVSKPRNHFSLEAAAQHIILLAGGIGITPILSMAEELATAGRSFALHFAARSADKAPYRSRILSSPFAEAVCFHLGDGPPHQKLDVNDVLACPTDGTHIYVCGPPRLIDAVLGNAHERGWPTSQIHREFFAAPADSAAASGTAFDIKIASTGQILHVPSDQRVAAVLAENGICIETPCENGVCGTCLTGVVEGEPEHLDLYLTPDEQAQNAHMTICCSRSKSPLLVLDL